jgi:hypothetical protein
MLHTQLQFRNSADYFGQPVSMDSQHVPEHGNGVIPGPAVFAMKIVQSFGADNQILMFNIGD